tara:strand:- start:318 stop:569 length:252 start_codon:yes stop_codon:yes gene_type:complete
MSLDLAEYKKHTVDIISHINLGFGRYVTIKEFAKQLANILGYEGRISFDLSKPDCVLQKKWIVGGHKFQLRRCTLKWWHQNFS